MMMMVMKKMHLIIYKNMYHDTDDNANDEDDNYDYYDIADEYLLIA